MAILHNHGVQTGGTSSQGPGEKPTPKMISLIDSLIQELVTLRKKAVERDKDAPIILQVEADVKTHPGTSRAEIAARTHLEPRAISRATERLWMRGKAIKIGSRRGTRWFLTESVSQLKHLLKKE